MANDKNAIPNFLKENFNSSVVGKIKLNLYKLISGKDDYLPDESEIKSFLRKTLCSIPKLSKIYRECHSNNVIVRLVSNNL